MKSNPIKIHGGKQYLADWIISKMPKQKHWHLYREPFFGGGAVLFRMSPNNVSEVINDLDENLTRFWMVLQSKEMFADFQRMLETTPFSEVTFKVADEIIEDRAAKIDASSRDIWRAWAFFVRFRQSRQGLGKDFATPTQRLRRGMNENVSSWLSAVEGLQEAHTRLKRVEIRNMDFREFIPKFDNPKALFYLDPPYLHSTRSSKGEYTHEMTTKDHGDLLVILGKLKGFFLLSGYKSILYSRAAKKYGWSRHEKSIDNKASSRKTKKINVECLWTNH